VEPKVKPYPTLNMHSPIYCDKTLIGSLLDKWNLSRGKRTSAGIDLQAYLGFPLDDGYDRNLAASHALYVQRFERGALIATTLLMGDPVYLVHGPIFSRYWDFGHVLGPLGLPVADQASFNGGEMASFQHGALFWNSRSVNWLSSTFTSFYLPRAQALGWPRSDTLPLRVEPGGVIGAMTRFEHGTAYETTSGTMFSIGDPDLAAFYKSIGGPAGELGALESDTKTSPGGAFYNNCARGVIVRPASGAVYKVTTKTVRFLHCDVVAGSEGPLGGGPDLYLEVTITFNGERIWDAYKLPDDRESYELGDDINKDVDVPQITSRGLRGEDVLTISVRGRDHKDNGEDDDYGVIEDQTYTIDNRWGFAVGPHDNGQFRVTFRVLDPAEPTPPDDPWRKNLFWNFSNSGGPDLTKAEFEETYTDVGEGEKWYFHPMNAFFYGVFYKHLANSGRCFGMCLAEMYCSAYSGYYNQPIARYSADPGLWNEIEIKHGYQLGEPAVRALMKRTGRLWSARNAFTQIVADPDEMWLVNFTKNLNFLEGHTVRVYDWEPRDPNNHPNNVWVLYVANPNYPYSRESRRDAEACKIIINPDDSWSIRVKSDEVWSGNSEVGGWIYAIGFRDLCYKPRSMIDDLPLLIAAGLVQGGVAGLVAMISGGGRLHESEHTEPATRNSSAHRSGPEAFQLPIFASGGGQSVVCMPAGGGSLELAVVSDGSGTPASIGVKTIPFEFVFNTTLPGGAQDQLRIDNIGTANQSVSYAVGQGSARSLTISFLGRNSDRYDLKPFSLLPGQSVTFSMTECMRELRYTGPLPKISATIVSREGRESKAELS
jgi:hypothetical protein